MALTYTPSPEFGQACPEFALPSVDGQSFQLSDFTGTTALLVMFICNHCPYVKAIEDRIIRLARHIADNGGAVVAICSKDPAEYPEDAPEELKKRWLEKNYGFPYLVDEQQDVARSFGAVCTPDFFLYDKNMKLAYRGRLDDSWKDALKVDKQELKMAFEAIVENKLPAKDQVPSMGCSIKWKGTGG